MKRTQLKKYLIFMVILFSLTALFSCKRDEPTTSDDTGVTEIQDSKPYTREITDSEFIEFAIETASRHATCGPVRGGSYLFSFYKSRLENEATIIKEYNTSGATKLIAGYLPKESIELVFGMDTDTYLQKLNATSISLLRAYLSDNNLSYHDLGFKLYYVKERAIKPFALK